MKVAVISALVAFAAAATCTQTTPPKTGLKHYPTTEVGGIEVIDTPIVREIRELVYKSFPTFLYKHVMRTWLYGAAQMEANATLKAEVDIEAHAVATLLHDLGWDMRKDSPWVTLDHRFELDGVNGLHKFVTESPNGKGFDWWRLEQMMDGIRLHGSFNLQPSKTMTVQMIVNSIQLDNPGVGYPGISNATLNGLFAAFPNNDIAAGANETFTWMAVIKPDYTYGTTQEQFGTAYVPGYNATGHHAFDIITAALLANESYVPRPVN
ncbi:hypothetical protein F5Y16DRAFT_269110 [Xylariaceae sp. FL0255]|nr:hypothetical protein F5Y16DRAFT_269110 [Xylariaceae sp. FL0255]